MFFKSPDHKNRFLAVMQEIGKVYGGKLDPEYAAAVYILTSTLATYARSRGYIRHDGIDIEGILTGHFSSGYKVLVMLAGNLFNSQVHIDPVELMLLDSDNFKVALTALQLRRVSYRIDEF